MVPISSLKKTSNKMHPYYRWIKKIRFQKKIGVPKDILTMLNEINNAEKEDYNFHQQVFKNCSSVRKWVLKEDYLDYDFPNDRRENSLEQI